MNYINRAIVKQQAKTINQGKTFYLFIISIIVLFLVNLSAGSNLDFNNNTNYSELFRDNSGNDYSYSSGSGSSDYFDDFAYESSTIKGYELQSNTTTPSATQVSVVKSEATPIKSVISGISGFSFLVGIIFQPLLVTLAGLYLSVVRRGVLAPFNLGKELGGVFKNSFNDTYFKKLLLVVLRNLIEVLLLILFIVPGIVFYYSSYFSEQIMSDNPNLKPSEAIKLSKKMIKGNRSELFALDLSFLGWFLLCCITFGIASIYVIPYYMTTKALYYENFRMRALQEGRITIDDFVSVDEKIMNDAFGQYNNQNPNGTYYTNPTPNAYEQSTGDVNTEQNSAPTENQAPTNFTDDYYVNPLEHQNDNQNDNQQ